MRLLLFNVISILISSFLFQGCCTSPTESVKNTTADITFISYQSGDHHLITMNMDGNNQINITDGAKWSVFNFNYTPDGKKILFWNAFNDATKSLYFYDIKNRSRIKLTDDLGEDAHADISPNGDKIVFLSTRFNSSSLSLCILDLTINKISHLPNPEEIIYLYEPKFSPDGSKIVYFAYINGDAQHIYLINSDGSGSQKLTESSDWNQHPQFSPDGNKIIFIRQTETGRFDIYSIDLSGKNLKNLTYDSTAYTQFDFSISHDGSKLFYTAHKYYAEKDSSVYELRDVNLTNEKKSVIAKFSDGIFLGENSLDGSKFVFQHWYDGSGEICIMDSDGNNVTRLTNSLYHCYNPKFRPNY